MYRQNRSRTWRIGFPLHRSTLEATTSLSLALHSHQLICCLSPERILEVFQSRDGCVHRSHPRPEVCLESLWKSLSRSYEPSNDAELVCAGVGSWLECNSDVQEA